MIYESFPLQGYSRPSRLPKCFTPALLNASELLSRRVAQLQGQEDTHQTLAPATLHPLLLKVLGLRTFMSPRLEDGHGSYSFESQLRHKGSSILTPGVACKQPEQPAPFLRRRGIRDYGSWIRCFWVWA